MNSRLLTAALAASFAASAASQDVVAVKAGKLLTISGPTLEDQVVLIENGRIKQIGKPDDVEIPWTAKVIDAADKVVMPTWVIAHDSGGMRSANENMQNVPWMSVRDAIDPASTYFEGEKCPLATLGHNRDGKKGKLQVNFGLLTNRLGIPVAVSVFKGNTGDPKTLLTQVQKVQEAFEGVTPSCTSSVLLGDSQESGSCFKTSQ